MLRHGHKPVIFVVNNRGYTIERYVLGMHSTYNDVADWNYTQLPGVFAPNADVLTLTVRTEDELETALERIGSCDTAAFTDLRPDRYDAPEALKSFGRATADFDYGPRGPQHDPMT